MISVCILTKNAALTLKKTLESTKDFSEVLLLDNGSSDETLEIAKCFPNVKIVLSEFIGFGPLRNKAASLAKNDWILALDSDEVLSPSLIQELSKTPLNPNKAYALSRHNYYNGKWIKGCGWYPEKVYRLYHREKTSFKEIQVHESLKLTHLEKETFQFPLFHTPYLSQSDFLRKMEHYSTLFALEHQHKKRSSLSKALLHAFFAFFKSYLLKKGVLLGKEGFCISFYNANTAFYKYLKLYEINQKSSKEH